MVTFPAREREESGLASIRMYATQWCPYCNAAKQLLRAKGQEWDEIDVGAKPGRRAEMTRESGRRSVPQIWIEDRHIGGYDELAALEASGELDALL